MRDIIAEPLRCLRIPGDHLARIAELVDAVGLEQDSLERFPHEFSGGQRQRIAIARALAPGPALLVGDEPFSALDATVRVEIVQLVERLIAELGLSLVLVSHDLGIVRRLCTDVIVLRAGRVIERGPTADVFRSPQHPYTRALIAAVPHIPASPEID